MAIATIALRAKDVHNPSRRTLRRVVAAMDRDGAVRFDGLFAPALLRKLGAEVRRRHESGELRREGLVRDIGGRYAALLPLEGPFLDPRVYANPFALEAMAALLGPGFVLSSLETVISLPGSSRQHQHIDGPIRFDRGIAGRKVPFAGDLSRLPPYAVSLCAPLCDVDDENGGTAIWAGSHRAALEARPPGEAAVARKHPEEHMTGKLGRAFMFDFRVFHGGLPNFSREPRPILMLVFTRPWYRDPNMAEVQPNPVITPRALARVPAKHRGLFALAPAARRRVWPRLGL